MKYSKWVNSLFVVFGLSMGSAAAQSADPMQQEMPQKEVVGTITNIDGMAYTIRDLRGAAHQLQLEPESTAWGSPDIGSEVKAVVEGETITELINLDE